MGDEFDTFGITLPVQTWQKLLKLANCSDRAPSDYIRQLINREAQQFEECKKQSAPIGPQLEGARA